MLIRLGYDIQFDVAAPVPMVALLNVHPSRSGDLQEPDDLRIEPPISFDEYTDGFGNRCTRFLAPQGRIRLLNSTLIEAPREPETAIPDDAVQHPVDQLPTETLQFLLGSRYCEVDLLSNAAADLFNHIPPGPQRVREICNWVHQKVAFNYATARSTKTALDVFTERVGVCRDYQHLALTFCRCMNIPARYATGYLGDIGVPPAPPMDFSAWFEVYLGGRWWTCDARFNVQRIGRVLMAVGRDAADVALTTSFGLARLAYFEVVVDEVLPS